MVKTITHTFFISDKVGNLGYNGNTYKTGDKIEINDGDLKGFDLKWLIPIKDEKPEETTNPEPTKEIKEVTNPEPTEPESKEEKKSVRGRRKVI